MLVPSSQGGWVIWAHLAPAADRAGGSSVSGLHRDFRPRHAEGWEGPGAEGGGIPRAGCAIDQEVPAGWGIDCGQDMRGCKLGRPGSGGGQFTPAEERIHCPSSLSAQICLLLQQGEPGEAELMLPLKHHLVQLTATRSRSQAHRSRSQAHLVPLTGIPGPGHRHTWPRSRAHLVTLTGTPGPAHRHLVLLQARPPSWILQPSWLGHCS